MLLRNHTKQRLTLAQFAQERYFEYIARERRSWKNKFTKQALRVVPSIVRSVLNESTVLGKSVQAIAMKVKTSTKNPKIQMACTNIVVVMSILRSPKHKDTVNQLLHPTLVNASVDLRPLVADLVGAVVRPEEARRYMKYIWDKMENPLRDMIPNILKILKIPASCIHFQHPQQNSRR